MLKTIRAIACTALLTPLLAAPAQTPAASAAPAPAATTPAFDIADVHPSPHSNDPFMRGGQLHGDRYILRDATMVDLVANAYNVDPLNVLAGPAWLELDRFDIYAKAPRTTSPDDLRLMLRALLAQRFHLVVHTDIKSQPAFVLSVAKNAPKMKPADASADPAEHECKFNPPPQNAAPSPVQLPISFTCHSQTMADLTTFLHQTANPYLKRPVVDQTNLKGAWDFDIRWSWDPPKPGADGITIFEAVDKLGLKLESKPAPLPVVFVDSVDQKPTPNPPGLDKILPPPPPPEFDVAVIKPTDPSASNGMGIMLRGNQFNASGLSLQFLLTWAWDVNNQTLAGAPKGLNSDKYDILAKIAQDPQANPNAPPLYDFDDIRQMVRNLVIDRFQLKYHMEDQPQDAYNLVAANPHMKKADPANRAGCHTGPGPDGKDPRIANPILSRLITCQNVTMAQFAELIQPMATGYIKFPILDQTNLDGAYDFTLSFSTAGAARNAAAPPPPPSPDGSAAAPTASDPSGAISLPDAMYKTLGLKLEKVKRPVPMLVIDHIEEKPTDN